MRKKYTPVNPSFTISKWGVMGCSLYGLVFVIYSVIVLFNLKSEFLDPDRDLEEKASKSNV